MSGINIVFDLGGKGDEELLKIPRGIYLGLCINCGGPIEDNRIIYRNACSKCMNSKDLVEVRDLEELAKHVTSLNPNGRLNYILTLNKFVKEFEEFFQKSIGSKPWSLEISWALRVAQHQSFAMIAPTGVGKTTFGLVMTLFLSYKYGKKVYIIVPTTVLVEEYEKRLWQFSEKLGITLKIIAASSKIHGKRKIELEESIASGSFDILITTSAFLQRNFNDVFKKMLSNNIKMDLIFVDDVDAIIKGSKAIDMVLQLLGFSEEDISNGYKMIDLRRRLLQCENARESSRCYIDGKPIDVIYEELQKKVLEKRERCGILIVASATGRARGKRIKLFRELLGFSIGTAIEVNRNVVDAYIPIDNPAEIIDRLVSIIKILGSGGLIYVPLDLGQEYAVKLATELNSRGIRAGVVISGKSEDLKKFIENELDVVVGVATYYGLLVRGIDIPERIRYAIFVGVPRHKISLTRIEYYPQTLLRLLSVLVDVVEDQMKDRVLRNIAYLRRILRRISPNRIFDIVERLKKGEKVEDELAGIITNAYKLVNELLSDSKIIDRLKKHERVSIIEEEGQLYILIPDAPTYIQASGRTSRLFMGGITRGLSIIFVDDTRLLRGLEERIRVYIDDFRFQSFNEINLEEILKQIDEDRRIVNLIKRGLLEEVIHIPKFSFSRSILFIVESPNKARTIASFFGRPTIREIDGLRVYEVDIGNAHLLIASSGGHVFDIVEEELSENNIYGVQRTVENGKQLFLPIYGYLKRCSVCGAQFVKGTVCPICGSTRIRSSEKIINALQKIALEVDEVIIATDPDSEGEKIGYDMAIALAPYAKIIRRAEFHEVTRKAILSSLYNPRGLKLSLIEAQIVRRIEDRWLGFALSDYVTKRFKELKLESREGRLSAGRVQTPVLGRVIEIYINRLRTQRKYKIFSIGNISLEIPVEDLKKIFGDELKRISKERVEIVLKLLSHEIVNLNPMPPFTTDELIVEAQRQLGIDAVETMRIAQDLFELGFITYHRTDSTRISSTGISIAHEYLLNKFGDLGKELFVPRTWGEGGAHEAIRPTRAMDVDMIQEIIAEQLIELPIRLTNRHLRIYDIIFRRFIASQMKSAKVERNRFEAILKIDGIEVAKQHIEIISNIVEPGYTLIYMPFKTVFLPHGSIALKPLHIKTAILSDVKLPTQGDLVKWMKDVGIGRPSTYAKIVEILLRRGYTFRHRKGSVLIPSITGIIIYNILAGTMLPSIEVDEEEFINILQKHPSIRKYNPEALRQTLAEILRNLSIGIRNMVSVERTRMLYNKMQEIEEGRLSYINVLSELFREMCSNVINMISSEAIEICKS
ncbi:reverse gyrase [Ignisphaera aggregans DSM 17230]|uniref:Reverse gyrase n=1 Tax=Ignisphaera aggregans (strain DSM 17230 / JCM 13409 / AQ1.S1) TaxID=583356 RepID=E0STF6_IGNAA|nr:reverse gyrase [Ignisphaera aggregans DSM 17230]